MSVDELIEAIQSRNSDKAKLLLEAGVCFDVKILDRELIEDLRDFDGNFETQIDYYALFKFYRKNGLVDLNSFGLHYKFIDLWCKLHLEPRKSNGYEFIYKLRTYKDLLGIFENYIFEKFLGHICGTMHSFGKQSIYPFYEDSADFEVDESTIQLIDLRLLKYEHR